MNSKNKLKNSRTKSRINSRTKSRINSRTKSRINSRTKSRINSRTKSRTKKRQFFFNPNNPKKSFDVYIDKNPKDTIHIKYKTLEDVKNTIVKLEKLYKNKKYTHKRIWQVAMIMNVRLRVLKHEKPKQYNLSTKYLKFLGNRTKLNNKERYDLSFYI